VCRRVATVEDGLLWHRHRRWARTGSPTLVSWPTPTSWLPWTGVAQG
jgi:hypothetical protein